MKWGVLEGKGNCWKEGGGGGKGVIGGKVELGVYSEEGLIIIFIWESLLG